ncbi:hypothetical protein ACN20G_33390 (plasmid) [Streptomyces sp. BI20]|uniref:hypothetical protein n=1 Tax=Streptomyces sp. BI20 TaxID=3403460 RepID=UPI003C73A89B
MTLINPPLLTHGGTHSARAFRMMIRDLARGSQGVTEGDDLRVSAATTPGASVVVADGSAVVLGAQPAQGAYTQYNVGPAVVPIAPTGAAARSDLIVLRVEDPEYEGTRLPDRDDIGYFHVVPNVPRTTTSAPAGMTAVSLARVDLPASTAVVTAAMVTDLRKVANPRLTRRLATASPLKDEVNKGGVGDWVDWPSVGKWAVAVPEWAVTARIIVTLSGLQVLGPVHAWATFRLGTVEAQGVIVHDGAPSGDVRVQVIVADTLTVPKALRGTTQTVQTMLMFKTTPGASVEADTATTLICDVEFEEGVY